MDPFNWFSYIFKTTTGLSIIFGALLLSSIMVLRIKENYSSAERYFWLAILIIPMILFSISYIDDYAKKNQTLLNPHAENINPTTVITLETTPHKINQAQNPPVTPKPTTINTPSYLKEFPKIGVLSPNDNYDKKKFDELSSVWHYSINWIDTEELSTINGIQKIADSYDILYFPGDWGKNPEIQQYVYQFSEFINNLVRTNQINVIVEWPGTPTDETENNFDISFLPGWVSFHGKRIAPEIKSCTASFYDRHKDHPIVKLIQPIDYPIAEYKLYRKNDAYNLLFYVENLEPSLIYSEVENWGKVIVVNASSNPNYLCPISTNLIHQMIAWEAGEITEIH
jgi:hypothetical protein